RLPCLSIRVHCAAQALPPALSPGQHSAKSFTGKARYMPLSWVALHILLAICIYHSEIQQNLILRGNTGAAFFCMRSCLWSGLARILPLRERTISGARHAHEVKLYAI